MSGQRLPTLVFQLPSHAYVPGQSDRHPEDTFSDIRATAVPGHSAIQLACSDAFRAGLQFLHAGYFWEAHEVLEPVWMALPDNSQEKRLVQGLIQLANGRLKLRMERPRAAMRLVGLSRELVPSATDELTDIMLLNLREVHSWINALERAIK